MENNNRNQEDRNEAPEEREEYSFLQETIKDEAKRGRKIAGSFGRLMLKGLVFGLAASLVFSASKPWFDKKFGKTEDVIIIPEEEKPEEKDETKEEEKTPQEQGENQYREINRALTEKAIEVGRCVVSLTGNAENDDWTSESYDTKNLVSGVILAETSTDLLIFAKAVDLKDASDIRATFTDGRTYQATLYKKDGNLSYGIYAVSKSQLNDATAGQIRIAVLGSSATLRQGDTVIVSGSPFGYEEAIGFGVATASGNEIATIDGVYSVVNTDIPGAATGTGVLANIEGEIVGIVDQSMTEGGTSNVLKAYGISDLKRRVEKLLNNQSVPYMGIDGVTVTDEIAAKGIPTGVYVRNVVTDSPAMAAGIQKGDIIVEMEGKDIATFRNLSNELLKTTPGETMSLKGFRQGARGEYVDISFDVMIGINE